jgi:hypothetical protein
MKLHLPRPTISHPFMMNLSSMSSFD